MDFASRFQFMSESGYLLVIPPEGGNPDVNAWRKPGDALMDTFRRGEVNLDVLVYAALGRAWRLKQPRDFNDGVKAYGTQLARQFKPQLLKCTIEAGFNQAQPFYSSMVLYVLVFLLAVVSWLKWPETLQRSAFWLLGLAFVGATAGIVTRMWLEGRPPVTNLYSSAVFVGWVAVALCLVLERIYKNAIGAVAGGMIGFGTLLIAHHLSLSGDTMEMMRAVLDSNFWLATHVVVITMGYGSTFLAGFLAIIYISRGTLTKSLTKETADALTRMVYGIVCFATLFSLVGTVLGGIWADQSWGRFWGWDPKENGALIIVLWNAIILHCRWGGLVKQRGLMMLAVFGNIVTSWSWFGVNMLGVGLHSYGFMQAAFYWLIAFVASQVLIIGLAALPRDRWRSFQTQSA
jgi:ABC-type transport system involved in cytochrome c biogenesis permease subunit